MPSAVPVAHDSDADGVSDAAVAGTNEQPAMGGNGASHPGDLVIPPSTPANGDTVAATAPPADGRADAGAPTAAAAQPADDLGTRPDDAPPNGATSAPGGGQDPPPAPAGSVQDKLGKGFWALLAAFFVSNLGTGITSVAFPWLTTSVTRDPLLVAGVGVMAELPWLLLSLPIGAFIDRVEHKRVISVTHSLRALLVGIVAICVVTDSVTVALLYAFAFVVGTLGVTNENATQTILPRVVPSSQLERANGNLIISDTTAGDFLGPLVGGVLVGISLSLPFFLDVSLYAVAAVLITLVAVAPRKPRTVAPAPMRTEIAVGLRYFWRHPTLRTLGIFLGMLNISSAIAIATQVLFAQEILGFNSMQYGLMFSVGAVGAAVGGSVAPLLERRLGARRLLLVTLAGSTLVTLAIGSTSSGLVVGAALMIGALLAVCWNVVTISYRQRVVPEDLLGRVNSIYRLIAWGPLPLGSLLGGLLVTWSAAQFDRHIGLRTPLFVASVITFVMMLFAITRLKTGIWSRDPTEYRIAAGKQQPAPAADGPPATDEPSATDESPVTDAPPATEEPRGERDA